MKNACSVLKKEECDAVSDTENIVKELKKRFSLTAAGYISRDGMPKYVEVPEGTYPETFSIMCATVLGAASTAAMELGEESPDSLVAETENLKLYIVPGGMKGLLVAAKEKGADGEEDAAIIRAMKESMEKI